MSRTASVDVVIFGGGVAGLWTRCVLSKGGYSVVLVDDAPFGTGQMYGLAAEQVDEPVDQGHWDTFN